MKRYKMNQTKSKYGIIIAMLLIVGGMATCQFAQEESGEEPSTVDSALFHAWKQEKEILIENHEYRLSVLTQRQDSLYMEIAEKKALLSKARVKAKDAEKRVYELLARSDSGLVSTDSIQPLIASFADACEQNDSLCSATVLSLEQQIQIKDNSLFEQSGVISVLRQINSQQEIQIGSLCEKLDQGLKQERKLLRRNRWLKAGACLLAGISTSLFITRTPR